MDDPLLLTDDEVAALAADRGRPWPAALPTIDDSEPGPLAAAAFRGARSLFVRGLGVGEPGRADLDAFLDEVLGATCRIEVFLGDETMRVKSHALASAHHVLSSGWVFEAISVIGVHRLTRLPSQEHLEYIGALLAGASSHGPRVDGTSEAPSVAADWLCASAIGPEGGVLVRSRRNEVSAARTTLDVDGPAIQGHFEVVDARDAVALLDDVVSNGSDPRQPTVP